MLNALVLLPFAAKAMMNSNLDGVLIENNPFDKIIGDLKNTCELKNAPCCRNQALSFLKPLGDASGKESFSDRDRQFVNYLIWAAMNHGMREQMNACETSWAQLKASKQKGMFGEPKESPQTTDDEMEVLLLLFSLENKTLDLVADRINKSSTFWIRLAYMCTSRWLNWSMATNNSYWQHCACKMILDAAFEKPLRRYTTLICVISMYICTPIAFFDFCRAAVFGVDNYQMVKFIGAEANITGDAVSGLLLMGTFLFCGLCWTMQPQKHKGCKQTFVNICWNLALLYYFFTMHGNLTKYLPFIGESDSKLNEEDHYYELTFSWVHGILLIVNFWSCLQCCCAKK